MYEHSSRLEEALRRFRLRRINRWWEAFAFLAGGVDAGATGEEARQLLRLFDDEIDDDEYYPLCTQDDFDAYYEYVEHYVRGPVVVFRTGYCDQDGPCFTASPERVAAALMVPPEGCRVMVVELPTSTICTVDRAYFNAKDEAIYVRILRRNSSGVWKSLFEDC